MHPDSSLPIKPTCCPCQGHDETSFEEAGATGPPASRGRVPGSAVLGGMALGGLSWSMLAAASREEPAAPPRRPLIVKPIFTYPVPVRHPQTSWRNWGGIQNQEDINQEAARIQGELEKLRAEADFPLKFLPLAKVRGVQQLAAIGDIAQADAILSYAGGDGAGDLMAEVNAIDRLCKDVIFFVRHQSGPLYYWYEGASARYLRQHADQQADQTVRCQDVVVDRLDEVLWRLRALAGLRATVGSTILAIGGPAAWASASRKQVDTLAEARRLWKPDIRTVSYPELSKLLAAARSNPPTVILARDRAEAYLKLPQTKLETSKPFVENAFLLEQVFRALMHQANCRAITIRGCMRTIMPIAQTTACLALSLLNDAGYLAFCESDFAVIPSGMLLGSISGRPTFLNDPTYPHDGIITLAHCTAPRKMDGVNLEPVRILTHFESDYGAAPKVEMAVGRKVTMIAPDFASKRWLGLSGEIEAHPFLPICRSQIDVRLKAPSPLVAQRMPGFHWTLAYGDYLRELGYALRRVPIGWECLG